MKTYSLDEVVAEWGLTEDMSDPVRWLANQIRAGRVRARKIGRSWRMTQADVDAALEVFASKPPPTAVAGQPDELRRGLSAASLNRRIGG